MVSSYKRLKTSEIKCDSCKKLKEESILALKNENDNKECDKKETEEVESPQKAAVSPKSDKSDYGRNKGNKYLKLIMKMK